MVEVDSAPPARWGLVVGLGVTQIVAWGSLYYAFALVIEPLARATGGSQAAVVGAFSFALLVTGLASSPIGARIDRLGGRQVMTLGSLAAALLLGLLPQVQSLVQLYLVFAGLGLAMAATLYDPAFAVLAQVFQTRQRKAITMLTLFGGFASTIFWPFTQHLVAELGWQRALQVLALLQLLICAPLHAWLLPGRGTRLSPVHAAPGKAQHALASLLRDPVFYGLCAAFTGNSLVFSALSVHLLGLLAAKGLTLAQAAWIGALIGPMQVLGRVLEYRLLSRWHSTRVGVLAMWLLPLSLAWLQLIDTAVAGFVLFALMYGSSNGVMTIVRGAIPAELYDRAHYGAVNGAMATPVMLAKAAGPLVASAVMAWAPHGAVLWVMAGIAAVAAAVFSATVRRREPALAAHHGQKRSS